MHNAPWVTRKVSFWRRLSYKRGQDSLCQTFQITELNSVVIESYEDTLTIDTSSVAFILSLLIIVSMIVPPLV
jgi:hypothetical protein